MSISDDRPSYEEQLAVIHGLLDQRLQEIQQTREGWVMMETLRVTEQIIVNTLSRLESQRKISSGTCLKGLAYKDGNLRLSIYIFEGGHDEDNGYHPDGETAASDPEGSGSPHEVER